LFAVEVPVLAEALPGGCHREHLHGGRHAVARCGVEVGRFVPHERDGGSTPLLGVGDARATAVGLDQHLADNGGVVVEPAEGMADQRDQAGLRRRSRPLVAALVVGPLEDRGEQRRVSLSRA
jgi:hypothetical protein